MLLLPSRSDPQKAASSSERGSGSSSIGVLVGGSSNRAVDTRRLLHEGVGLVRDGARGGNRCPDGSGRGIGTSVLIDGLDLPDRWEMREELNTVGMGIEEGR